MSLSKRLLEVAKLVDTEKIVADVGCDHALLSIYLIKEKKVKKVYAIDNKKGPLTKAIENIKLNKLEKYIETQLSDGLTNLTLDVDLAIMAGIGGLLAIKMLETASRIPDSIIIQANNHLSELRTYLTNHNFKIVNELIVKDSEIYYEILKIKKGNQRLNELDIMFGPFLRTEKSPLFIEKWTKILNHYNDIVNKNNISELIDIKNNIRLINTILDN